MNLSDLPVVERAEVRPSWLSKYEEEPLEPELPIIDPHHHISDAHWGGYRLQWRKVHLGIDAQTLEIRAIEVTDNTVGDAPMLPHLLNQVAQDEPMTSVIADGAYDTKACHAAIAARGAVAVIPPRKNARAWRDDSVSARARNDAVAACKRLGRGVWKIWSGYHRRSLVETKMHCFKRLGERVMARTFERQVVELHVRVALLNRFNLCNKASRRTIKRRMALVQPSSFAIQTT